MKDTYILTHENFDIEIKRAGNVAIVRLKCDGCSAAEVHYYGLWRHKHSGDRHASSDKSEEAVFDQRLLDIHRPFIRNVKIGDTIGLGVGLGGIRKGITIHLTLMYTNYDDY